MSSRSTAEDSALFLSAWKTITAAYTTTKHLPILSAAWDNNDPATRNQRRTAQSTDYLIDIEKATEHALKDEPALQKAWFDLVLSGREPVTQDEQRCVTRCGRVYMARHLWPTWYFRKARHHHAETDRRIAKLQRKAAA